MSITYDAILSTTHNLPVLRVKFKKEIAVPSIEHIYGINQETLAICMSEDGKHVVLAIPRRNSFIKDTEFFSAFHEHNMSLKPNREFTLKFDLSITSYFANREYETRCFYVDGAIHYRISKINDPKDIKVKGVLFTKFEMRMIRRIRDRLKEEARAEKRKHSNRGR